LLLCSVCKVNERKQSRSSKIDDATYLNLLGGNDRNRLSNCCCYGDGVALHFDELGFGLETRIGSWSCSWFVPPFVLKTRVRSLTNDFLHHQSIVITSGILSMYYRYGFKLVTSPMCLSYLYDDYRIKMEETSLFAEQQKAREADPVPMWRR